MRRFVSYPMLALCTVSLALMACKDPSKGKPAAKVGDPIKKASGKGTGKAAGSGPASAPSGATGGTGAGVAGGVKFGPANGTVGFVGSNVGGSHIGKFERFSGMLALDAKDVTKSQVSVTIDVVSVKTDKAKLDKHLRSDDFFAAKQHPQARFVSTSIAKGSKVKGSTHTISGNFTLRGVTKGISFPASLDVGAKEVRLKSTFKINRMDFGVSYAGMKNNLIRKHVVINLDFKVPRG